MDVEAMWYYWARPDGRQDILMAKMAQVGNFALREDDDYVCNKNWLGLSQLHLAVKEDKVSLVKALLSVGVDANTRSRCPFTPIFFAKSAEVVNLLVTYGANVNMKDYDAETPLHLMCSAASGALPAVKAMLLAGADVSAINFDDETPMDYAMNYGNLEIATELLKFSAHKFYTVTSDQIANLHASVHYNSYISEEIKGFIKIYILFNLEENCLALQCSECDVWAKFVECCEREVIQLRKYKIRCNFSLYDFLTRNKSTKPLRLVKNIQVTKILKQFPIYKDYVEENLNKSMESVLLCEKFMALRLYSLTKDSKGHIREILLDSDSMEKVASYLKDYEKLKFINVWEN